MAKYTSEDIKGVASDMRDAMERGCPYAFLTGAGISKTAKMPLSHEIIALIKKSYPYHFNKIAAGKQSDYGVCMNAITSADRKDMLDPYLKNAGINFAHIALACLMKAGFVGRVLTFNFDAVLARACGLCGLYPAIYDFGVAPAQTFDHIAHPAVLHLHGQGAGLHMLNTAEETSAHAANLAALFADTFHNFPVLTIGYSGASDGTFEKIKEGFKGKRRLYCADIALEAPNAIKELCAIAPNTSHFLGGADADAFLVELARELDCYPPDILRRHQKHLLHELATVVKFDGPLGPILHTKREQLKKELEEQPSLLMELTDLMLNAQHDDVIARASDAGSNDEKELIAWAHIMQGNALDALAETQGADGVASWRLAFEKYEAALVIKPDSHEALYNWGLALANFARTWGADGTQQWQLAFEKYKASLEIKPNKIEALYQWGLALVELALTKSAAGAPLWQQACDKFEAVLAIEPDHYDSLLKWGFALAGLAKLQGASGVQLWKQACQKYDAALAIKPDSHEALNNWGLALAELAQIDGTAGAPQWQQAFDKYAAALAIKPDKHEALSNWGAALSALGRTKGASGVRHWRDACQKYEAALAIKPDFYMALHNWGLALAWIAQFEGNNGVRSWQQACQKYEAVLKIKQDQYETLDRWGVALAQIAFIQGVPNAPQWEQAYQKFATALTIKPDHFDALQNWGFSLRLHANTQGHFGAPLLREAIQKYEAALAIKPDNRQVSENLYEARNKLSRITGQT